MELPDIPLQAIGHYGRIRLNYLQEHRPGLYTRLILSGKLYEHLAEIDQTEEMLKTTDQMSWVGQMNNIRQRAEEVILNELIYA